MATENGAEYPKTVFDTLSYVLEVSAPGEANSHEKPEVLNAVGPGNPSACNTQMVFLRLLTALFLQAFTETLHLSA